MKRRSFLASLCALPMASCQGGERANVRFKVIAKALVDGQPVERSTVMEVDYWKVTHSLLGTGGGTRLYGEGMILDFENKPTLFILPFERQGGALVQAYEDGILKTFGINHGIGSLTETDYKELRAAHGRRQFRLARDPMRLPTFVSFADETNPKTIYQVDPWSLGPAFEGVQFLGLDVEITDEPITKKLFSRLPWLGSHKDPFDQEPAGSRRPSRDRPLSFLITTSKFFGDGSR